MSAAGSRRRGGGAETTAGARFYDSTATFAALATETDDGSASAAAINLILKGRRDLVGRHLATTRNLPNAFRTRLRARLTPDKHPT